MLCGAALGSLVRFGRCTLCARRAVETAPPEPGKNDWLGPGHEQRATSRGRGPDAMPCGWDVCLRKKQALPGI